jgi:hypothetical protein
MKRLGVCVALFVLVLATPAAAARQPEANFDGGYSCDEGGASIVVWLTREYRWPGKVKIWDGKPFVRDHLKRVVTYRYLVEHPDGGVVVGELSEGRHRMRSTWRGRILDRQRYRIDCV